MIKGAIFDVDGTVLDSMGVWQNSGETYLHSISVETEEGLGEILFSMSLEDGANYMKSRCHLEQTQQEIIQGVLGVVHNYYYKEASLKKGIGELLEILKSQGIRMVVATSSDRDHIEAAFARLGLNKYFEKIYTCSEVGVGKESPLIFRKAAKYLRLEPEEIAVFEDALYAVQTAKAAGFHTVGIYDPSSAKAWPQMKETADISIEEMNQLAIQNLIQSFAL